jgi:NAD(P)-dependent dehydrogenase (short-subunit alcohol dehydrogenase family)
MRESGFRNGRDIERYSSTRRWSKTAGNKGSHDPAVGRDFAVKNVLRQRVGRIGEAKDIAFAVCMIASPINDFMTGTTFRVDGGATPTVHTGGRRQFRFGSFASF